MRTALLLPALLIAASSGARAEIVDIRWSDTGAFDHRGSIAAGKTVEVCGRLTAATRVRWRFEASTPLDFNVHYHVGKEVVFVAERAAVGSADDMLRAPVVQDYCWMWTNKGGGAASLSVSLLRQ